jgi:hypothetical protein
MHGGGPDLRPRPALEPVEQYAWMRERVLQIRDALLGHGLPLIAAASYVDQLESVDPMGH